MILFKNLYPLLNGTCFIRLGYDGNDARYNFFGNNVSECECPRIRRLFKKKVIMVDLNERPIRICLSEVDYL